MRIMSSFEIDRRDATPMVNEKIISDSSKKRNTTKAHDSSPVVRFATPRFIEGVAAEEDGVSTSAATLLKNTPRSLHSKIGVLEDTSQIFNQSSFTPILTPNRSGDVVLLSPSRTITETLKSLATLTGQQLEEVWDEVGYSPEDRASQLNDLIVKFRDLCEAKIAEEKGVAETFRQTIGESKQEIQRLSSALQKPSSLTDDSSASRNGQTTLTDELSMLETALERLRASAAEARRGLQECRDFLIDAHEALGIDMDPKWRDIDSNLSQQRQEQFQVKRTELKGELMSRSAAVVQLVRDCQQLMRELAIEIDSETATEVDRRIAGSLVRSKDDSFMMASKHRTETCVGISNEAMAELSKRLSELHVEKNRRRNKIRDMGHEISKLWEKLRVPEDEQIAFSQSVQGIGLDTIRKGEAELQRLMAIKTEMIGQLILEAREEIEELWDQIDADEIYRSSFQAHLVVQDFDDQLLDAHEAYLKELQARFEERKPILRLIERREAIVKERMEYEKLQKDPDRLKQRTAAVARQLMEEEKMARRIKRDLPKLTNILTEKLLEWKERHGEDFMFHGCLYSEEISRQENDWSSYKEQKHQKMLHKKQEDLSSNNTTAAFPKKKQAHQRHPRQPLVEAKMNHRTTHRAMAETHDH